MEQLIQIQTDKSQTIAYRKAGKGPALVLLHGFPEDSTLWRNVWPALSLSYTLLIPDLPGSGASSLPLSELSMENMATCVKLILDNEGIGKAVIVGHSMGGYAAMAFAEKFGEHVSGLSMVHSAATADDDDKKENRRKAIDLIAKGGEDAFIRQMVPNLFSEAHKASDHNVVKEHIERGRRLPAESLMAFYNAMIKRPDRTNTLVSADFPVQWIAGADDKVIPARKLIQQSRLANVNFVSVYEDCGHMSMIEKPQLLIKDLQEFATFCFN